MSEVKLTEKVATITKVAMIKKFIYPKVYRPKDGIRGWFVYYSFRDPETGVMKRFKIKKGFSGCRSRRDCEANAKSLISSYRSKLQKGYDPFESRQEVEYVNALAYENSTESRKKKGSLNAVYFCNKYLELIKTKKLTDKTYRQYQSKLRKFEQWLKREGLARVIISDLTIIQARDFFLYLVEELSLRGKTLNGYRSVLMGVWLNANEMRKVESKPEMPDIWKELGKYKNDVIPQYPIQKKDVLKIKKHCLEFEPQLWMASLLMMYCFIRPNELRNMKWKHVDIDSGKIRLPGTITKGEQRSPDIPEALSDQIEEYYKVNGGRDDDYIFTINGIPGESISGRDYLSKRFARVRNELSMSKKYTFYCFKHTGAVMAIKAGANIKDLQTQMGHKHIETTDEYLKNMVGYNNNYFRNGVAIL